MRKSVFIAGLILAGVITLVGRPAAHAEEASAQNTATSQPIVVEVQKGDSLSKIATTHQTTYNRLYDANTFIQDPNVIHPGEKVRVPDASEQLQSRTVPVAVPQTEKPAVQPQKTAKKQTKTPAKQKTVASNAPAVADGSVWDALARCESGGNWSINTGNGYYGGLQFTAATWKAVGGQGLPHQASREEQIMRGQILQARSGWGQWPACTKKLGLR